MNSSSDLPGRLALFSWRQPVRLLLILLLPTLILGILALRLAVDASVLGALTDDDPDVVQLRELQEVFPHSGALVLLIEGGQEEERQRAALEAEEVFGSLEVVEDVRAHWSSTEELERLLWAAEDHRIDQIETLASGPLSTALGREDRGLGLLIMQLVNPLSVRAHSASLVTKQLELLAGGQTDVDSPGIPVEDGWYRSPDRSLYLVDLQTSLDPIGGTGRPPGLPLSGSRPGRVSCAISRAGDRAGGPCCGELPRLRRGSLAHPSSLDGLVFPGPPPALAPVEKLAGGDQRRALTSGVAGVGRRHALAVLQLPLISRRRLRGHLVRAGNRLCLTCSAALRSRASRRSTDRRGHCKSMGPDRTWGVGGRIDHGGGLLRDLLHRFQGRNSPGSRIWNWNPDGTACDVHGASPLCSAWSTDTGRSHHRRELQKSWPAGSD